MKGDQYIDFVLRCSWATIHIAIDTCYGRNRPPMAAQATAAQQSSA